MRRSLAVVLCVLLLPTLSWAVSVQLTWDYTQSVDPNAQATVFWIYRQAACSGVFVAIASVTVATLTYTDGGLFPGTYCWQVTARTTDGRESTPSNTITFQVTAFANPAAPSNLQGILLP